MLCAHESAAMGAERPETRRPREKRFFLIDHTLISRTDVGNACLGVCQQKAVNQF